MRSPDLSAILIYPNTRDLALASLGFLKVREMLAERLGIVDHACWPGVHGEAALSPRRHLLVGDRTRSEAGRFHIVAFSVSYENDFVHLPELLLQAGLPALASARQDLFPLVVGGGFAMSVNPLPVADFLDAVVVGEAEPVLDRLLEEIDRARARDLPKGDLLKRLGSIEGLYVPSLGEREVKRVWSPVDSIAADPPEQARSHFGEMHLVEVGRCVYLIGSAEGGVDLIAEVTEKETLDTIRLKAAEEEGKPRRSFHAILSDLIKPSRQGPQPGDGAGFLRRQRDRLKKL